MNMNATIENLALIKEKMKVNRERLLNDLNNVKNMVDGFINSKKKVNFFQLKIIKFILKMCLTFLDNL
jgi:hypothetical protein